MEADPTIKEENVGQLLDQYRRRMVELQTRCDNLEALNRELLDQLTAAVDALIGVGQSEKAMMLSLAMLRTDKEDEG